MPPKREKETELLLYTNIFDDNSGLWKGGEYLCVLFLYIYVINLDQWDHFGISFLLLLISVNKAALNLPLFKWKR